MMNKHFYAVIMAGGEGTRLWPLSRRKTPKQLLKFIDGKSLFQIAVERLHGLIDPDHIFVVTIQEQVGMLQEQAPEIPHMNYLIEPMPKGTASVVGMAATYLKKFDLEATMAVLTADHVMENVPSFQELLTKANRLARRNTLVTIGIQPTFASIGYGYIEIGEVDEAENAYQVKKFVEKPDAPTAEKYFTSGNYYWNSGMFIWSVNAILAEFKRQMPDLAGILVKIDENIEPDGSMCDISSIWETIKAETIDYGIMEGAQDVTLIPALDLGWKDLGSWDSLFTILESDDEGNIGLAGKILNIESYSNFIQTTNDQKMIAVIGINDLIIVDHENTLLICKKGESQRVKQIVNSLKNEKLSKYL